MCLEKMIGKNEYNFFPHIMFSDCFSIKNHLDYKNLIHKECNCIINHFLIAKKSISPARDFCNLVLC